MAFHVEMQTEQLVAAGMEPEIARRQAMLRFGARQRWREEARDQTRAGWLEETLSDLRYAGRRLCKEPGMALVATVTLGLGIAASATALGFADSLYNSSLDVPEHDRLVRIEVERTSGNVRPVDYPTFEFLAEHKTTLDRLAAHYSTAPLYVAAAGPESSRELQGAVVSEDYFGMLGIQPAMGRFFTPEEYRERGRHPVVVIGNRLWRESFGSSGEAVGNSITINGVSFVIVGVAPTGFTGVVPSQSVNELWLPISMLSAGYRWCDAFLPDCAVLHLLGRLAPGTNLDEAERELPALVARAPAPPEADRIRQARVTRALGVSSGMRRHYGRLSALLGLIALLVFTVACINVSGLLLARGLKRRREMALRASLGAGRLRLIRQLLTESLLLAGAAWVAGSSLSLWAVQALSAHLALDSTGGIRQFATAPIGLIALAAGLIALLAVIIFGLVPALEGSRVDLAGRLALGRGGDDKRVHRSRTLMLTGQLALSFALVVAGGLLSRSAMTLSSLHRADTEGVVLMRLRPRLAGYQPDVSQRFLSRVTQLLESRPGVISTTMVSRGGTYGGGFSEPVSLPATPAAEGPSRPTIRVQEATPGFFQTMMIPVLEGRSINARDSADSPPVALVDNTTAARLWPGRSAIGEELIIGEVSFTVIGVFANYQIATATDPASGMAVIPFWQHHFGQQVDARLAVRVMGDPTTVVDALAAVVAAVDPLVPVTERTTLEASLAASFADLHLGRWVALSAALVGLVISAAGLFGVISFLATSRQREFGVRLALGASPREVATLVLKQGWLPLIGGLVAGTVLALVVGNLLASWLVGVSRFDPAVLLAGTVSLLAVATMASVAPVRKAARVDPVSVLRTD